MRVAHIIKVTRISGAERHLLFLLQGLRQADIDAHLIILVEAGRPMDEMMSEAETRGIPIRRLLIRRDLDPGLLPRLRRALVDINPDLVHTHLIHADLYGCLAGKWTGARALISTRHNDDRFRHHPIWRRLSGFLWRATDAGIVISSAIKAFAIDVEGAPADKLHLIHYGMQHNWISDEELGRCRSRLRAELGLEPHDLLLGMICRLVEQKGIPFALRALQRIQHRFPDVHLVIAGDGKLLDELQDLSARLGIAERVHWLGWRVDAVDLIAAFDILLLPSLWEGFGLVLLEAMSRRIPVIASKVSAIPEVLLDGQTGLLTEPGDVPALAEAMTRLLDDRALRQHMGLLGAARLEAHFSVKRMVDKTLDVYRNCLR